MSKRTIEYRCLLISPSDVDEERAAVADMIDRWNAQVGESHDASVRLVMWETHAVPDVSAPAQEVLNRDIVDECDFGIAVFWTRLGSPTTIHESGSIEEIERLRQRGARVLVYMSSAPIPQERLKDDQYHRLSEFRKRLRNEGLLGTYHNVADLREQILLHTTTVIIDLLQKDRGQPSPDAATQTGVLTAPKPDVRVIVFAAETIPPTSGIRHLLGIRIQNHSPVAVYMSGISILLTSGHGLLLVRDVVTGAQQSRVVLRPGESYQWSTDGDSLLRDYSPEDVVGIVAHDDIGREFRESEGTLRKILDEWVQEDKVNRSTTT